MPSLAAPLPCLTTARACWLAHPQGAIQPCRQRHGPCVCIGSTSGCRLRPSKRRIQRLARSLAQWWLFLTRPAAWWWGHLPSAAPQSAWAATRPIRRLLALARCTAYTLLDGGWVDGVYVEAGDTGGGGLRAWRQLGAKCRTVPTVVVLERPLEAGCHGIVADVTRQSCAGQVAASRCGVRVLDASLHPVPATGCGHSRGGEPLQHPVEVSCSSASACACVVAGQAGSMLWKGVVSHAPVEQREVDELLQRGVHQGPGLRCAVARRDFCKLELAPRSQPG